jgi:poly(A) polymerase
VFPILDVVLDEAQRGDGRESFVQRALGDTDRRVGEGKPVVPSFMLACMLWHDVLDRWQRLKGQGEPPFPALQHAIDSVFEARIGDISGRGRLAADMREVWMMQPRFERRVGSTPLTLVEQPRFRAGFDFLRLRADAGELDAALADWWQAFSLADPDARREMIEQVRTREPRRRHAAPAGESAEGGEGEGGAPAAKKRRRRRRKPAGGASSEGAQAAAPAAGDADGGQ